MDTKYTLVSDNGIRKVIGNVMDHAMKREKQVLVDVLTRELSIHTMFYLGYVIDNIEKLRVEYRNGYTTFEEHNTRGILPIRRANTGKGYIEFEWVDTQKIDIKSPEELENLAYTAIGRFPISTKFINEVLHSNKELLHNVYAHKLSEMFMVLYEDRWRIGPITAEKTADEKLEEILDKGTGRIHYESLY